MNNTPPIQLPELDEDLEAPPDTSNHTIAYDLLNDAIRVILKQSSTETPLDIKPYRLLTSLFDKPQIGPVILDSVLYDVFRALYLSCLHQQKQKNTTARCVSFNGDITSLKETTDDGLSREFLVRNCQDLIKNANLLFNTLQNYYIWWYIEKMYKESVVNLKVYKKSFRDSLRINDIGSGAPSVLEICILTDFLLDIIPVESYADNTSEILPNLFNRIVCTLKEHINVLNRLEIVQSLRLCSKILSKIQPVSLVSVAKPEVEISQEEVEEKTPKIELSESKELKGLEKSKSDSKINENLNKSNELTIIDDLARERSNSNQMLKKKEKTSPKIDKKSKNKKSKSSSKLYDLKNEEIEAVQEKAQQTPLLQLETLKTSKATMKVENKSFLKCLEEYKQFYVAFIRSKIIPDIDIPDYFQTLVSDKEERTRELHQLLDSCLNNTLLESGFRTSDFPRLDFTLRETPCSELDAAMAIASDLLLEFSTFPNCLEGQEGGGMQLPVWLEALVVCACCSRAGHEVQIIAMNTLLEIFSLAKSRRCEKNVEGAKSVAMGILESECVVFVEESTVVVEVSV